MTPPPLTRYGTTFASLPMTYRTLTTLAAVGLSIGALAWCRGLLDFPFEIDVDPFEVDLQLTNRDGLGVGAVATPSVVGTADGGRQRGENVGVRP